MKFAISNLNLNTECLYWTSLWPSLLYNTTSTSLSGNGKTLHPWNFIKDYSYCNNQLGIWSQYFSMLKFCWALQQAFSQRGVRVSFWHPVAEFGHPNNIHIFLCIMQWDKTELDTQFTTNVYFWTPNSEILAIALHYSDGVHYAVTDLILRTSSIM